MEKLLKSIDAHLLTQLSSSASQSQRLRLNHNLHSTLDDPIQRLCNAFEPGTYIRPHRHPQPGRWELFLALTGHATLLLFSENGTILERAELVAGGEQIGVEVPPGAWHSLISRCSGTVLFEVKPGPYTALSDKDFAAWAPQEYDPSTRAWLTWWEHAQPGERLIQ